jgi:hypothetical protein
MLNRAWWLVPPSVLNPTFALVAACNPDMFPLAKLFADTAIAD